MNKVVYLITTKGCEGCKIMSNIATEVFKEVKTFDLVIRDFEAIPTFIKINVPIGDFPLLVFTENDVIKYHMAGTMSKTKLKRILGDISFV